jgi:hypothetical protein
VTKISKRDPDMPFSEASLSQLGRHRLGAILNDEELAELFRTQLYKELKRGGRTGLNIYYDCAAKCGIQHHVAQQVWIQVGAASEHEARRSVALVKEAEAKPLEEQVDDAVAWLTARVGERPDLKSRVFGKLMPLLAAVNGHAEGG